MRAMACFTRTAGAARCSIVIPRANESCSSTSPGIGRVRVEGHTDSDGNPQGNLALSEKRAGSVISWLTGKGIDAKRLHGVGCGARDPLVPNTSAENKQKNRRTEFDVEDVDGHKPDGYTDACVPNPALHH